MLKNALSLFFLSLVFAGFAPAQSPDSSFSTQDRHRVDLMISVFENDSMDLRYDYIEDLHDGRGYTAGRAGFCSGTGDLLEVVEIYTKAVPETGLAVFRARLHELADSESDSISGLQGLTKAWTQAARDPRFRAAQDQVVDALYFKPAMRHADEIGARLQLTRAALYEAIIQHGDGDDPDSLGALIERASQQSGGTPAQGIDEKKWLHAFLIERRADLAQSRSIATRKEWRASVGRADAVLRIFESGNFDFHGPIRIDPFGTAYILP